MRDRAASDFDALRHLQASATFNDLDEYALEQLTRTLTPMSLQAGDVLIAEVDPPSDANIVDAGYPHATEALAASDGLAALRATTATP